MNPPKYLLRQSRLLKGTDPRTVKEYSKYLDNRSGQKRYIKHTYTFFKKDLSVLRNGATGIWIKNSRKLNLTLPRSYYIILISIN